MNLRRGGSGRWTHLDEAASGAHDTRGGNPSPEPASEYADVFMQPVQDAEPTRGSFGDSWWRFGSHGHKPPAVINRYVLLCALLASVSAGLLGYDTGVMSGAVLFIEEDFAMGTTMKEILVGSLNLVSIVGAIIAGRLSDIVGRRVTLAVSGVIFFVGAMLMALAGSYSILLIGRIITGVGVGFSFTIAPVYTSEVSPASARGFLVSLFELCVNLGILVGYIASYALAGLPPHVNWRVMLGAGALPAIALGISILFLPESPRWLTLRGRTDEAREVLRKTSLDAAEVETRFAEIMEALGQGQQQKDGGHAQYGGPVSDPQTPVTRDKGSTSGQGVWRELVLHPEPCVQRMLLVALGTNFFQQATGIDAIVYYSPTIFKGAGIRTKGGLLGATIVVGMAKSGFVFVASLLMDRVGRRFLLLISSSGMAISMVSIGFGFLFLNQAASASASIHGASSPTQSLSPPPPPLGSSSFGASLMAILGVYLFASSFAIGLGPVNWVLSSEIFPMRLRAQALGLATVVNRLTSSVVALTFLSISEAITPAGTFFVFSLIGFSSIVFFYKIVPETKGKSLEEIEFMFRFLKGSGNDIAFTRMGPQRDSDEGDGGSHARVEGREGWPKREGRETAIEVGPEVQEMPLLRIARHDVEPPPQDLNGMH